MLGHSSLGPFGPAGEIQDSMLLSITKLIGLAQGQQRQFPTLL